jgi:hypothetical protein
MLGDARNVIGKNLDNKESYVLALWMVAGFAGLGALTGTLDLFGTYSMGTEFATLLSGTWDYSHVVGAAAIAYSAYTSQFGVDKFKALNPAEQAIVVGGIAVFVASGFPTSGLYSFLTSSDIVTTFAVLLEGAALFAINDS